MAKIKRSQVKTFLNITPSAAATWVLVGDGVVNAKINYNPKTLEETYITQDSANVSVESYAPSIPIEMTALNADAAFEYIDALRKSRAVLADVETEIVNVWLYENSADGFYPAEKQAISIQTDDFGGEGGTAVKMNYTVNFLGNPTPGIFNPTAPAEFDAEPVLGVLETMVIGEVVLTPLFDANPYWLLYTGSVAAETVAMTSTCIAEGAEIIQRDTDGEPVAQGDPPAPLKVGVNHLTIEVTVDLEVVTYHIDITRTA